MFALISGRRYQYYGQRITLELDSARWSFCLETLFLLEQTMDGNLHIQRIPLPSYLLILSLVMAILSPCLRTPSWVHLCQRISCIMNHKVWIQSRILREVAIWSFRVVWHRVFFSCAKLSHLNSSNGPIFILPALAGWILFHRFRLFHGRSIGELIILVPLFGWLSLPFSPWTRLIHHLNDKRDFHLKSFHCRFDCLQRLRHGE